MNLVVNAGLKSRLEAGLKAAGIGFGNIYPGPMSGQPGATARGAHYGGKNAATVCASVLNLPLFPYMTEAEFGEVLETVAREGVRA